MGCKLSLHCLDCQYNSRTVIWLRWGSSFWSALVGRSMLYILSCVWIGTTVLGTSRAAFALEKRRVYE
ncbi:hypothetical protein BDV38DRAFT_234942 [Aspergillus pseudotamarii]|uniref:Uncharacterized protein n=1 Tax=Aspergillus pseudotamarii TaxID=132259 RepID=A0A5N6T8B8_ASPPS|nr:uncharacterized protein BDV38DRAFT_234942 [Aspergillus pseudotamarii]KAE8142507.1 hypothetical protein BDV38DRAFT_234942 [Aspergillus pseudotamarii]